MKELGRPLKAVAAAVLCVSMIVGMMLFVPSGSEAGSNDARFVGYVKDTLGNPIPDAYVKVMLFTSSGVEINSTFSGAGGYYAMDVPGGQNYAVFAGDPAFYMLFQLATVLTGGTTWLNFSLESILPDVTDVTIKGFAKDALGNPSINGHVLGVTNDPAGGDMPYYANLTTPNATGYYEIRVLDSIKGGGVVGMDFPLGEMVENTTKTPLVSGQTYWFNLTIAPTLEGEDSVLTGIVRNSETGDPIPNAMVSVDVRNNWTGFGNLTFTDTNGAYRMDVVNGSATVTITLIGYSMLSKEGVNIASGQTLWLNATLAPAHAVLKGNVTDLSTGDPINMGRVFLFNETSMSTMVYALTNATGFYEIYAFVGPDLVAGAEQDGYGRNVSRLSLASGDVRWMDFGIWPVDSWITGHVVDYFSMTPISGAQVDVSSSSFDAKNQTDSSGYFEIKVVHGNYTVDIYAPEYRNNETRVVAVVGTPADIDVALFPMDLPMTVKVWGYLNDSVSGIGIDNARVTVSSTEINYQNGTSTDPSGRYEMMVPPMDLRYRAGANQHALATGMLSLVSFVGDYRMDLTLERDVVSPSIVFKQDPVDYISWSRPSMVNVTVIEDHISQLGLGLLKYLRPGSAGNSVCYIVGYAAASFDPWLIGSQQLDYTNPSPGVYNVLFEWNGTVAGGWFGNASHNVYIGATVFKQGPMKYLIMEGNYQNTSTPSHPGMLIIDYYTFELLAFVPSDQMLYRSTVFPDATGQFSPIAMLIETNMSNPAGWWGLPKEELGTWSASDMQFESEPKVPSGTYMTFFTASDEGGNGNGSIKSVTVDNDVPVADAGGPQTIVENTTLYLGGGGSSDSMGIANYTWTIDDQGTIIATLWGMSVEYVLPMGDYTVNLTATDNGGHISSDSVSVVATNDLPPTADAGVDIVADEDTVVHFNGSASSDDVGIVNGTWTIVELFVEMWGPEPEFNFTTPGIYHVQLIVKDTLGQASSADEMVVTVIDITSPTASAGSDMQVSFGHAALLNGSLSADNLAVTNWTWNFTDMGAHAVYGEKPSRSFSHPGVFLVTLTVKDAAGNSATDSVVVTVVDDTAPTANAGPDQSVDAGDEVTFDGSTSADDVGIVNYTWTIRNEAGVVGTMWGSLPKHTFTVPGTYNVTLDASDAAGNHGTDSVRIVVSPPDTQDPVANAGLDVDAKSGESVSFDGGGSTDNVGVVNYTWTFAYNGQTRTMYGSAPSFTFDKAGDYMVTLEVRDAVGNTATDTIVVHVGAKTSSSMMLYVGAGVAVVAAILVALAMLMRRKDGDGKTSTGQETDEEEEIDIPPPPNDEL